jgi:hypothetical protein
MKVSFLLFTLLASADAFSTPRAAQVSVVSSPLTNNNVRTKTTIYALNHDDNQDLFKEANKDSESFDPIPALTAALITFSSTAANAAGPDWGKSFSP